MSVLESPPISPAQATIRLTARAMLLGERLDTAMLERGDVISTAPLAFRMDGGYAVLFRYGIVVLIGLTPVQEDELLRGLRPRVVGPFAKTDSESALIEINPAQEDQITPGGPIVVRDLSAPRLLVIADILAKNVALSRDEREVTRVFEVTEPFAAQLAKSGRVPSNRREMLRTIGQALLVHHRISGRIEVEEKPDILWDHPQFERLHARLVDEYEIKERAAGLSRKLRVIDETARALTDIIDTERSTRLEATIVILIVVEILVAFYEVFVRHAH
ncbi:MAG TPA: RMD1 family protein [Pseudolabrys sp.]|jgi:uncharacterized Rmd1/YagE family protein|nr:RMD1 family protein [Pseudolabrys sp.]